jgi:hypothetical protein
LPSTFGRYIHIDQQTTTTKLPHICRGKCFPAACLLQRHNCLQVRLCFRTVKPVSITSQSSIRLLLAAPNPHLLRHTTVKEVHCWQVIVYPPGKRSILTLLFDRKRGKRGGKEGKRNTAVRQPAVAMATSNNRKPIHQQPKLCAHILSHAAKSGVPLRIGESSIAQAGSGLFAINDIPAGSEIFHTSPLIAVAESAHQGICDFCFLNSYSSVNKNGRFYGSDEDGVRPDVTRCGACKVARYCSKASTSQTVDRWLADRVKLVPRNARARRGRATISTNATSCKETQPYHPWTKHCVGCSFGSNTRPSRKRTCELLWRWRPTSMLMSSAPANRATMRPKLTNRSRLHKIYTRLSSRVLACTCVASFTAW